MKGRAVVGLPGEYNREALNKEGNTEAILHGGVGLDGNGSVGVAPVFRVSLVLDTNGIETVGIFGNSLMWSGNLLRADFAIRFVHGGSPTMGKPVPGSPLVNWLA